jgi:hypothetical protein
MSKFALFDDAGLPTAFYAEELSGSKTRPVYGASPEPTEENPYPYAPIVGREPNPDCTIPAAAIEISDDIWMEFLSNQGERRWNGSTAVPYTPPEPPAVVPASVSDRQFFQALAIRGEITEDEALDAVGPGIIPAAMVALIDQLPEAERFGAKMLIRGATVFERANPLADLIGSLFGWDGDALDEFWTFAATL